MTGLQRLSTGALPLETAFEGAKLDPIVTALLRPLPRLAGQSSSRSSPQPMASKRTASDAGQPQQKRAATEQAKGQSKGKRAKPKYVVPLPEELRGLATRNQDGKALCFNFNMSKGCQVKGPQCDRGLHSCMKCFGQHPAHACLSK
eukprot:3578437-Amphidinium_carterae.1